ncbi:MAG TPA: hypothetical protein VGB17_03050 [Pyrinomonadaceae bacterium]|jgi:hypothetical protein
MIAANLYADLEGRGVRLFLDAQGLRFKAPKGALNETLKEAMRRHRDELVQFVFDLEERAALMYEREDLTEEEKARTREQARRSITTATADGALWLREYAEHHPMMVALNQAFAPVGGVEIVSIERV